MIDLRLDEFFGKKKNLYRRYRRYVVEWGRRGHIYMDNAAPVLLVAHMDTVQTPRLTGETTGAGFDDRLGVALAIALQQVYPQWFDVLLTDFEEELRSTAKYFTPSHDYGVIVGLDRAREDVVTYGRASQEVIDGLMEWGFTIGWGTYSDVCFLDHVHCDKVNVGIGYYDAHGKESGYRPDELERQVARLLWWLGVEPAPQKRPEWARDGIDLTVDEHDEEWAWHYREEEECFDDYIDDGDGVRTMTDDEWEDGLEWEDWWDEWYDEYEENQRVLLGD